jgi:hypothetical protein
VSDGHHRAPGDRLFWLSALAGWAVIGYGLRGLLQHHLGTNPPELAKFVVGGALIHDLFVAPLVLGAGVLLARAVPAGLRAIVQAALIISASLALLSYPLVRDYARILHNPSSLPRNYTANLAIVLGVVWAVAAAAGVLTMRRRRKPSAGQVTDEQRA